MPWNVRTLLTVVLKMKREPFLNMRFLPLTLKELDTDAVLRGKYISISPLTLERTDMQLFRDLQALNP